MNKDFFPKGTGAPKVGANVFKFPIKVKVPFLFFWEREYTFAGEMHMDIDAINEGKGALIKRINFFVKHRLKG